MIDLVSENTLDLIIASIDRVLPKDHAGKPHFPHIYLAAGFYAIIQLLT
jgi:hypothetical protein